MSLPKSILPDDCRCRPSDAGQYCIAAFDAANVHAILEQSMESMCGHQSGGFFHPDCDDFAADAVSHFADQPSAI